MGTKYNLKKQSNSTAGLQLSYQPGAIVVECLQESHVTMDTIKLSYLGQIFKPWYGIVTSM